MVRFEPEVIAPFTLIGPVPALGATFTVILASLHAVTSLATPVAINVAPPSSALVKKTVPAATPKPEPEMVMKSPGTMVPPFVGLGEKPVMAVIRFPEGAAGTLAANVSPEGFFAV